MVNPAELDTRLLSHAARVDAANRYGALAQPKRRAQEGPGSFVLLLRRLSSRRPQAPVGQPSGGAV